MRKKLILIILTILMTLTACKFQNTQADYNSDLVSYMVSESASYYGEGQYYHEIQKVEQSELNHQFLIEASGEIKDNSIGKSYTDYTFNYQFLITDQSVFQTLDNSRLNDSDFKKVELLRLPLEVGHIWTFDAMMFNNKTTKMTAEILEMNDAFNEIKVKYTSKDYVETRVFKKALGVTDFTKEVVYKDVKAISGYHLEESGQNKQNALTISEGIISEAQNEENAFADIVEMSISQTEHDLILGFNQNYEKKINLEETQLSDYVMPESPAREKIDNLKVIDVGAFRFIEFKVKSKTTIGDSCNIEVVELYDLGDEQSILNTVTYTLKTYGDQLMIYDFK